MLTRLPDGCVLGAIIHRQDPNDALVVKESLREKYADLEDLPAGSVVGTSSTRRKALLAYKFPHLVVQECRGKLDDADGPFIAIIVATAGLVRIDMAHRITKRLSPSDFQYAVGQGALGIEIRMDDPQSLSLIKPIEDGLVRRICLAERALLRTLQGGCSFPVAVYYTPGSEPASPRLRLEGIIIHPRGTKQVSAAASADVGSDEDAEALGAEVARLLEEDGGRQLLDEIAVLYQNQQ